MLVLCDTTNLMTHSEDIVKSNALIEAAYKPGNVYQMRLLLAALMQVKAGEKLDFRHQYIITANALADLTNQKAVANYRELKKAVADLRDMYISVKEKPNAELGTPDQTDINVVSSCQYWHKEGRVSLRFTEEILPYISDLKKRFTQYQAKYVMPMRSSYGIRLYELCLQWLGNEREFLVDDFRRMFGLENKYSNIRDLKRRVIKPALIDINTYSDIRVKFAQVKRGRRVHSFQFMIVKSEKDPKPKKPSFDEYVELNARPGEDWKQAKQRLSPEYRKL